MDETPDLALAGGLARVVALVGAYGPEPVEPERDLLGRDAAPSEDFVPDNVLLLFAVLVENEGGEGLVRVGGDCVCRDDANELCIRVPARELVETLVQRNALRVRVLQGERGRGKEVGGGVRGDA